MAGQELLQRAVELRQRSEEVERSLQFVSEQIDELEVFSKGLESLSEEKERGMLASLGRGVFVKTERKEEEELFVEVGAGVIVKKSPAETRKIIDGQVEKFKEAKLRLMGELEGFAAQFREMMEEVEKLREEK